MSTNITYTENVTNLTVQTPQTVITLNQQGPPGPPGQDGAQGPKGDTGEAGQDGTGDKSYRVTFTNATSQVVTHNLDKYPAVVFKDSAGTEYEVDIVYDSLNQCTVSWNQPITGSITCN